MIPALEEIAAMGMKPFQAFPGQDHKAHIDSHLNFMQSNMVQNSPTIMGALQKNILERISLMAQEQIQLEFQEELACKHNRCNRCYKQIQTIKS